MEIGFEVLHRLLGERAVEQHRLLANLALKVIPPVVFFGICLLVDPYIEIHTEDTLVGRLANIAVDIISIYRNSLATRGEFIIFDIHLRQQIATLGQ